MCADALVSVELHTLIDGLVASSAGACSGYRVEKFDVEKGKWEKVAEVQGTKCKVPKLQEGHQYKFRIIAENKNGDSEPLETESPVTAKNPFGEFFLFDANIFLMLNCHFRQISGQIKWIEWIKFQIVKNNLC